MAAKRKRSISSPRALKKPRKAASKAASSKKAKPKPKKKLSEHAWDDSYQAEEHVPGCINRHVSYYAASNPCSHRAQGRLQAQGEAARYKWPKGTPLPRTAVHGDCNPGTDGNFKDDAHIPYHHEAHHIAANAELRNALSMAAEGIKPKDKVMLMMRAGLMNEGYNLNHKVNMIILPMSLGPVEVLGLPRHRKTVEHRNHPAYSKYIKKELHKAFGWLQEAAKKHKLPPYKKSKSIVETVSKVTYKKLLVAGLKIKKNELKGKTLDDAANSFTSNGTAKGSSGMKAKGPLRK